MKFFAMILLVMLGIYGVKMLTKKVNIPVVSAIAEQV
jgi:hypothetical protein